MLRSTSSADFVLQHKLAAEVIVQQQPDAIATMPLDSYDLIVLSIPPQAIIQLVPFVPQTSSLITDMSSTRRAVHAAFAARPELRFIGSHPMCGSENKGPQAGLPDLFSNSLCILLPEPGSCSIRTEDIDSLKNLWIEIGMQCYQMTPTQHDQVLAYLSHAPHVLSSLLTLWAQTPSSVQGVSLDSPLPVTGGGFKSMARIAGSNPEMWADILKTNEDNILDSLREFHAMLGELIEQFPKQDISKWQEWFTDARTKRDQLCDYSH